MSNLFPKYKKSHTLPTALLVKGDSFSFHFPLMSPTAPSPKPSGATVETPSRGTNRSALGCVQKGPIESRAVQGIPW